MTIREHLDRKRHFFGTLTIWIWPCLGAALLFSDPTIRFVLLLLGFAVFAGAVIGRLYLLKCLRCGGRLGMADARQPFRKPQEAKFCPYCGVGLDEEM